MRLPVVLIGLVLAMLAAAGLHAGRWSALPEGVGVDAAEPAIVAVAAAQGWRLAEKASGRRPPELQGWPASGIRLVLTGPTTVAVRGYYCSGRWCEDPIPAREAVELWLMPEGKGDQGTFRLQAFRVPTSIYASSKLQIFGLVSRWWPGGTFDAGFTEASSEASSLGPSERDLPVSWPHWAGDIASALDRNSRHSAAGR